ncbi:MAG: hypothetical protein AAF658_21105, partial [Myxococcota bacterium]
LDGGADDRSDHHNLVAMYDGYLVLPFAPEFGACGGIAFFDVSDPCQPRRVGAGGSDNMRETHAIGFWNHNGRWAVTNYINAENGFCSRLVPGLPGGGTISTEGGIMFWDVSNVAAPVPVAELPLDGFLYPDAYARVVQSVFWQAPYVYVSGSDNGIYIVDATDPTAPELLTTYRFEPTLRAAGIHAIGNLLVVGSAEGNRTVLLDISDPARPQPIPGGDFTQFDAEGVAREAYFHNIANSYVYYARKSDGGGVIVYDIRDPTAPTLVGSVGSDGNGGYLFAHKDFVITGESRFAGLYDVSDMSNMQLIQKLDLEGDLDTAIPVGNVIVLSVDDKANEDEGSAIAPWRLEPDREAPLLTWVTPEDGATNVVTTSRIGMGFDEAIDPG